MPTYTALYMALVSGDWERAKSFLDGNQAALTEPISDIGETALHTAVGHGHVRLVEELVKMMNPQDLEIGLYVSRDTALHIAARGEITMIAKILVEKNHNLLNLRNNKGQVPVTLAAFSGSREMLTYLYSETPAEALQPAHMEMAMSMDLERRMERRGDPLDDMFMNAIKKEDFDFALKLLEKFPQVATVTKAEESLFTLVEMPLAFSRISQLGSWKRWIYNYIDNEIQNMKTKDIQALELLRRMCSLDSASDVATRNVYSKALFRATKCGNAEFVEEILRHYPTLLWGDTQYGSIFHAAVSFRQYRVWNLIHGLSAQRNKIAEIKVGQFSLLHLAAIPIPIVPLSVLQNLNEDEKRLQKFQRLKVAKNAPGAAIHLQRELQWYKEVERMVPPSYKEAANRDGLSPQVLFTDLHSALQTEAEKWMRDTATSYTIVATLIVTIMFAAAITFPGGPDNSGNPIYLRRNSFMVYIISDAVSLFSSVTALLMFLSILTSRYAEEDFLKSLPNRLILGLVSLFLSLAAMMVTFGAALVLVMGKRITWVVAPVSVLSTIAVTVFALLQFPLLVDLISSTYGGFFKGNTKGLFLGLSNTDYPASRAT